jgi:hypothetical protein
METGHLTGGSQFFFLQLWLGSCPVSFVSCHSVQMIGQRTSGFLGAAARV